MHGLTGSKSGSRLNYLCRLGREDEFMFVINKSQPHLHNSFEIEHIFSGCLHS